jgi:hypothetical protein
MKRFLEKNNNRAKLMEEQEAGSTIAAGNRQKHSRPKNKRNIEPDRSENRGRAGEIASHKTVLYASK